MLDFGHMITYFLWIIQKQLSTIPKNTQNIFPNLLVTSVINGQLEKLMNTRYAINAE